MSLALVPPSLSLFVRSGQVGRVRHDDPRELAKNCVSSGDGSKAKSPWTSSGVDRELSIARPFRTPTRSRGRYPVLGDPGDNQVRAQEADVARRGTKFRTLVSPPTSIVDLIATLHLLLVAWPHHDRHDIPATLGGSNHAETQGNCYY